MSTGTTTSPTGQGRLRGTTGVVRLVCGTVLIGFGTIFSAANSVAPTGQPDQTFAALMRWIGESYSSFGDQPGVMQLLLVVAGILAGLTVLRIFTIQVGASGWNVLLGLASLVLGGMVLFDVIDASTGKNTPWSYEYAYQYSSGDLGNRVWLDLSVWAALIGAVLVITAGLSQLVRRRVPAAESGTGLTSSLQAAAARPATTVRPATAGTTTTVTSAWQLSSGSRTATQSTTTRSAARKPAAPRQAPRQAPRPAPAPVPSATQTPAAEPAPLPLSAPVFIPSEPMPTPTAQAMPDSFIPWP